LTLVYVRGSIAAAVRSMIAHVVIVGGAAAGWMTACGLEAAYWRDRNNDRYRRPRGPANHIKTTIIARPGDEYQHRTARGEAREHRPAVHGL